MITVTVSQAREGLSDLLGKVQHGHDDVMIMRHGKPVAVMIPVHAYEFYENLADEQLLREIAADEARPDYDPNDTIAAEDFFARLRLEDAAQEAAE